MKITINSIKKTVLLTGGLFLSVLSVNADDVQKAIDYNYLRTPEASAFKKYGEESVNEYTGTADISVPLYTIKSKDIEIPLVLRYDASGIKVEQEASWVGLGWNLMVGGCINYVCAGGHDMYGCTNMVANKVWTEYLTSEINTSSIANFSDITNYNEIRTQKKYYNYNAKENSNWMGKYPLKSSSFVELFEDDIRSAGMDGYVYWGYGERDFYSVNVMGKSFMFFVDPATLKTFNIGKAREEFVVTPGFSKSNITPGVGNIPDVGTWTITDSDGYIYYFAEKGEKDQCVWENRTNNAYTSCWYLTRIQSPTGEVVNFKYNKYEKSPRMTYVDSRNVPFAHEGGGGCCRDACYGLRKENGAHPDTQISNGNMKMAIHYLSEISTKNQTVTFSTTEDHSCSGKRLNTIKVNSYDGTTIKTINFSYGSFTPSTTGGNYASDDPSIKSPNRLKLNNVKEIASGETLTTSFSYNEDVQLPSKRSFAQDYWGYYNGRNNTTLLPTPNRFMTPVNNDKKIQEIQNLCGYKGADRLSRGKFMQAAILTKVVYPTGGYTTYEYEPNSIPTTDFTLTEKYRDKKYDESYNVLFEWNNMDGARQDNQAVTFELKEKTTFDIYLKCQGDLINNKKMKIQLQKWLSDNKLESQRDFEVTCMCSNVFTLMNSKELQDLQELSEGKYTLRIIPPNVSGSSNQTGWRVDCQLKGWHKSTLSNKSYSLAVGGLRVKRINNYDSDNKRINYAEYDYNGSGILLDYIQTIDCITYYNSKPVGSHPGPHPIEVYTITSGHSRMPAFFASCNPGIVGYSKVTKNKCDANGNPEKKIVTLYRNNRPQSWYGIDCYQYLDNGQIDSMEIRNADGGIVSTTKNEYYNTPLAHYATNMIATYKYMPSDSYGWAYVLRYPYILSRVDLTKAITKEYCLDGKTIITTKKYSYNDKNHQVAQIDEYRSKNDKDAQNGISLTNQIQRTKIKYTVDDSKYTSIANNRHRLNAVVETKNFLVENSKENCINTQRTDYKDGTYCFSLPISSSVSMGNAPLETRAIYTYDGDLNVRSVAIDGKETVYLWSYKGQYPIAKIEGLTYAEVKAAIGETTINTLLAKATPTSTDISSIRTNIVAKGGYITTYTFKPLFGILSETHPDGNTIYYEYDSFGRLKNIKDYNKKIIKTYEYHYYDKK